MKKTIFLIFLLLIACTKQIADEPSLTPRIQEETNKPNTQIVLREALGLKDIYSATGVINLDLNNNADSNVLFTSDFGAEIYVQKGTTWEKVNNIFGYSDADQVLPTASEYPPGLTVSVKPDLSEITVRPIILRVSVTGISSDSGKDVDAYLDVTIE